VAILITGAAGFIGAHLAKSLLARGEQVIGVDNFNGYYDPTLKVARARILETTSAFEMLHLDIAEATAFASLIQTLRPQVVIHLAAQAGVRHSIDNPFAYQHANLLGHLSVLEACRNQSSVEHLIYASSSSVYGDRPTCAGHGFRETDAAIEPCSLYAATKRSGELMSAAYSRLYGLAQTGLRFFTVYGPFGRPDMAYFSFTRSILAGQPIDVFGEGKMARDFTYIDDVIQGIMGVLDNPARPGEARIYNVGDNRPVALLDMIQSLERVLGREAQKVMRPMQPGDVTSTWAEITNLQALCGYRPRTPLDEGLPRFVD